MVSAIILLVNFVLPFSLINASTVIVQNHFADPCLPKSEFAMSGLKLYDDQSGVRRLLGQPERVTREKGEDDGGEYTATVLHYRDMRVEIVRGVVDRLYTTSSRTRTPSGIRVGMRYETVKRILGKEPKEIDGYPYCYRSCDEIEDAYFVLRFDKRMVLSSIDIVVERP